MPVGPVLALPTIIALLLQISASWYGYQPSSISFGSIDNHLTLSFSPQVLGGVATIPRMASGRFIYAVESHRPHLHHITESLPYWISYERCMAWPSGEGNDFPYHLHFNG